MVLEPVGIALTCPDKLEVLDKPDCAPEEGEMLDLSALELWDVVMSGTLVEALVVLLVCAGLELEGLVYVTVSTEPSANVVIYVPISSAPMKVRQPNVVQ